MTLVIVLLMNLVARQNQTNIQHKLNLSMEGSKKEEREWEQQKGERVRKKREEAMKGGEQ